MTTDPHAGLSVASDSQNLFHVYLRLRPPPAGLPAGDRFISVEPPTADTPSHAPTCITLTPPKKDRRRAVEKFTFTRVFDQDATQLDVFHCIDVVSLVQGLLAPHGGNSTDALLATLGVTGSGKSHTILGSQSQRGLTQLTLDLLFRSIGTTAGQAAADAALVASIKASDASEANISTAAAFFEATCSDSPGLPQSPSSQSQTPSPSDQTTPPIPRRHLARTAVAPQIPNISSIDVPCDPAVEYVVLISMYEVYNDRIFDLLTPAAKSAATKEFRRRPLPFKPTELSPERKIVSGLRKIICADLHEAIVVLEAGLHERRVACTLSNNVSSRSHGFFCIEVLKRKKSRSNRNKHNWRGGTFTIADLAGSERARDAKTAGTTLAEAGKINESLMYLGHCLQRQSATGSAGKPGIVPFRQCKLTELLFSNSFPSSSSLSQSQSAQDRPQKAVMIVTADPHGDFNATMQILRYSALARDVTVPQTSPIAAKALEPSYSLQGSPSQTVRSTHRHPRPQVVAPDIRARRNRSTSSTASEFSSKAEDSAVELARAFEESAYLRTCLAREKEARLAAETHLLSIEEKMLELEQAVREECVAEFEQRLAIELSRWKAGLQMAIERGEEHWDKKMEVFERGLVTQPSEPAAKKATENGLCDDKENVLAESLEQENTRLRREVSVLKRELASRGPAKRAPLMERNDFLISANSSPFLMHSKHTTLHDDELQGEILQRRIENLTLHTTSDSRTPRKASGHAHRSQGNNKVRIDGTGSPVKNLRKPKVNQWEV